MTPENQALERIQKWVTMHPESFITFSGGKDSTVVLHLLLQVNPNPKIAFFDSGFLYKQTYDYIKNIQEWWNVKVTYMTTTPSPLDQLKESGYWEIGKPKKKINMKRIFIDNFLEASQEYFDSPYSIYGLRAEESQARNILLRKTKGVVKKKDSRWGETVSLAPIWDWTTRDVNEYILSHKLPINTAYKKLRELGVPANKRRTGIVLGDGIHLGDWAINYQVDPSLGKLLETHFPLLQEFR